MSAEHPLTLYHSPNTRSTGARILLEELGVPYRLHVLDMKAGEQRQPAYLAVNPMGKVPAVRHGDTLITEQVAIYIYLGDRFSQAGLAPAFDHPDRGAYLRWLAFYGSSFEPAAVDRALKREAGSPMMSPYGDFDTALKTVTDQLARNEHVAGSRFSAADVLWGTALQWMTAFGIVPRTAEIGAYVDRVTSRPAFAKVAAEDERLAASHQAAASGSG